MAQRLDRKSPPHIRERRRTAALNLFTMTDAELEDHLKNPKELRAAVIAMIGAMRLVLKAGQ